MDDGKALRAINPRDIPRNYFSLITVKGEPAQREVIPTNAVAMDNLIIHL